MKDIQSQIRGNLFWISVKIVFSTFFGLLITTIIVRNLTVSEFGLYNLLFALLGYINLACSFGVNSTFQRYLPELYQKKDYYNLNRIVGRGVAIEFVTVIAGISLIAVFSGPLGRLLNAEGWIQYYRLFAPYYLLMLEGGLLVIVLSSLFLQKYVTIAELSISTIRTFAITAALMLGYSLKGVICAEVAAAAAYTLLLAFFYFSKFRRAHPVDVKTASVSKRRLIRYGGFTFINDIGSSVLDEATDYLIISAYLGTAAVGLYAFAVRIVRMFFRFLPTNTFQGLLQPVFFLRYSESEDYGELNRMFNLLVKLNSFLCFPFCIGLYLLGDKLIIYLFDPKYIDALIPLWIVITFVTIDMCMTSVGLVLKAVEKVEILLQSKVFSLYNLVGDILVVPVFGIVGVALVTGSAVVFKDLYCYVFAKKYTGIAIDWRGLRTILVNSLAMGLAVALVRSKVTGLASLVGVVLAGALLYLLMSLWNKPFTRDESQAVNKVLPRPIFPF